MIDVWSDAVFNQKLKFWARLPSSLQSRNCCKGCSWPQALSFKMYNNDGDERKICGINWDFVTKMVSITDKWPKIVSKHGWLDHTMTVQPWWRSIFKIKNNTIQIVNLLSCIYKVQITPHHMKTWLNWPNRMTWPIQQYYLHLRSS